MPTRDVGILTTDAELVIRSWSGWLEQATGISAADAVGRPLAALAPGLDTRGYLHRLNDVLVSATVQVLSPAFHKYLIPCAPRSPSRVFDRMQQHVTIGPVVDEGSGVSGLVITIEDVTSRLEHERELAETNAASGGFEAIAASLRDDDWRVRRATVEELSRSAEPDILHALLDELRRNHRNFSALSSALRLLATTEHQLTAPLASLLKDPDPDLRMQVALALGEQQDPAAAEPLLAALDDPDPNVRFHAIEALGRLRAGSAVDALAAIAESGDFFLGFAALDALALIDDPRTAPRLVRLLERPDLREPVLRLLATAGDVQVTEPLARVINESAGAAAAGAQALAGIHARETARGPRQSQVPELTAETLDAVGRSHLVRALADTASRRSVATVLGWLREPALAPEFVRLLDGEERDVALQALVALGESGVDHLLACCGRDDVSIVSAAAAALGQIGSRRATPSLLALLERGGPVGIAAAGALARISDPASFDGLVARAGHQDAALRQAVVGALNSIGHPDLPARTDELLRSSDARQRESGIKIGGYFGFASATDAIVRLLEDPVEAVRIAAIDHVPFIAVDDGDWRLAGRLGAETPRARAAIVRALAHFDTPHATSALVAALGDTDMWVRYYAARSLAGRHDTGARAALLAAAAPANPEPVRVAALDTLAAMPGDDVDRVILEVCGESNTDVAAAAMRAAGDRHTEPALAALEREARGEPGPRVSAALEGLARDGSLPAIETLQWVAAATEDAACARACAAHLGRLARAGRHPRAAVDALLSLSLVRGRLEAAREALLSLAPERIPDVAEALRQPSVPLRQRAVAVLGELRHPRATEHLLHALDDEEPAVREAAVAALGQLGARQVRERLAHLADADPSAAVRRAAAGTLASLDDGT